MTSPALGRFPNRALLTGAGFTKNWGGHLASELWPLLAGTSVVNTSGQLTAIFREHMGAFEDALAQARLAITDGTVSAGEVSELERAIVQIFIEQERAINQQQTRTPLNDQKVEEMLSLFGRGPRAVPNLCQGVDSGYVFTVNQDLLVERLTINGHMFDQPVTPGVAPQTMPSGLGRDQFRPTNDRHLSETRRAGTQATMSLNGNLNYIKLHGSYEWRSDDGRDALVVGGTKEETIASFPTLATYLDVFDRVCASGNLNLMVCGYGFGDRHINRIIARCARDHDLSIFLIDTRTPQATAALLMGKGPDGASIDKAIRGWSTKPLAETFPPPNGDHRSPEYRRILQTFFRWDAPS